MVFGVNRNMGLLGSWAMRIIAAGALGLTVSGLFTRYYSQAPAGGQQHVGHSLPSDGSKAYSPWRALDHSSGVNLLRARTQNSVRS
jgi:hypothetical protein